MSFTSGPSRWFDVWLVTASRGRDPTTDDLALVPTGTPHMDEPANDYDPEFFRGERWGFIQLRQTPVISVNRIQFAYPAPYQAFYTVPNDWIRLDKRAGVIRLVPASAAFTAPLNAFLMMAMGGGQVIPNMIEVTYVTGLQNVTSDPQWADLVDVIYKKASLKVIEDFYLPQSASISGDGLSQSIGFDASKYRELIQETLFGPKGSNGGLYTYIHGLVVGFAGITA